MIEPNTTPSPPCPHCAGPRLALTCTCRGCKDLSYSCPCQPAVDELIARDGLCDGCHAAGCHETLAAFPRCRRLPPIEAPSP